MATSSSFCSALYTKAKHCPVYDPQPPPLNGDVLPGRPVWCVQSGLIVDRGPVRPVNMINMQHPIHSVVGSRDSSGSAETARSAEVGIGLTFNLKTSVPGVNQLNIPFLLEGFRRLQWRRSIATSLETPFPMSTILCGRLLFIRVGVNDTEKTLTGF